jgi:hypothetical protein
MDLRPSRLTTGPDGWTWLAAASRGARLRQAFWSVVLSLLLIVLAAAATLPPPSYAVPLVALVVGVGAWLARTLWSRAHSAVAVSPLGIAVRSGFDVAQVGWPAIRAVLAEPAGRRVRIVVESSGGRYRTASSFSQAAAREWLDTCAEHARRRHLRPQPLEGAEGFAAG